MSNPNPVHKFKKGIITNPKGRPVLPIEIKEARRLNKIESCKIIQKYAWASKEDILKLKNDKIEFNRLPLYEQGILNSFVKYSDSGDLSIIQFWAEHLIGKPKEVIEMNNNTNLNLKDFRESEKKCQSQKQENAKPGKRAK